MELKIGVQYAQRELVVETDEKTDAIEGRLNEALASGTVFSITDTKGRQVLVPGDKITYVEIGNQVSGTVGFR